LKLLYKLFFIQIIAECIILKYSSICLLDRKYLNFLTCLHLEPVEDQESCKALALQNVRKRKRVTFGEDLSPEVFDESLPANTPLRKGGTPVRQRDLSSVSPLLLEQSPVPEQLLQPNFDDKGENLVSLKNMNRNASISSGLTCFA
jgi:hypothetical protein